MAAEHNSEDQTATVGSDSPQVLVRAFSILDLFQPAQPTWSAAEAARELGLSLPTASRLMRALQRFGLLMRADGRRYRLGFGAIALGSRASRMIEVRELFRSTLLELRQATDETWVLATVMETHDAARVVDCVEGGDVVRISLQIGHQWPLHAGALAKVLLAHMPERDEILKRPLERLTENTITDPVLLAEELEQIRRVGWARSVNESEINAWGVAAAVIAGDGLPIASIGVISPRARWSQAYEERLIELVTAAVQR